MWPVGCSVFGYYYFNLNAIQCPHGRAPSVATGIRRTNKDAIVIIYQGDGDLAGIGMGEIIHAASRGENMTVLFVNNTVYGMTGGQMAPTTINKQITTTTPDGRDLLNDGYPINVCNLINSLDAPAFIERVSLDTVKNVIKTKKVISKAINNQINKKGFSLVEILSPCPTNLRMDPITSRKWISETLINYFTVKNYRDVDDINKYNVNSVNDNDVNINDIFNNIFEYEKLIDIKHKIKKQNNIYNIRISGSGGEGIISAGIILANCAKYCGYNVTYLPSYGAEMRGGIVRVDIVVSNKPIKSPIIDEIDILIATNKKSFVFFKDYVRSKGEIIINSDLINDFIDLKNKNIQIHNIPIRNLTCNEETLNKLKTNSVIIMLAFLIQHKNLLSLDILKQVITNFLVKKELIENNNKLIDIIENFCIGYSNEK